jgi:hypothetical protein
MDVNSSRIVRVNALQGLYELVRQCPELKEEFVQITQQVKNEQIPSLNARIKKILKAI